MALRRLGILLFAIILAVLNFGDVIYLKSGMKLEGEIVKMEKDTVTIKLKSGSLTTVSKDAIAYVETSNKEKEEKDLQAWLIYDEKKKSPLLAVFLSWLFPSLGHAYAGDWGRGLSFLAAEVVTATIGYTLAVNASYSTAQAILNITSIALVIERIWEYVDAWKTAEEYNKKLKLKLGLTGESPL